jgi:hypothetical protein
MKLSQLIKSLQTIKKGIKGDPSVVIDHEEDVGWWDLDDVHEVLEDGEIMINLKSSNES